MRRAAAELTGDRSEATDESEVFASVTCRSSYPSALISSVNVELLERPLAASECTLNMMSAMLEAALNQSHFKTERLCAAIIIRFLIE